MSADFEHFNDDDELWLSEMETRAIDLENELSVWREAREQALAGQDYAPTQGCVALAARPGKRRGR